jgi:hypothetical protein
MKQTSTQISYSVKETIKHGVPQGSILRPLLSIIYEYISDLRPALNTSAITETSVIISSSISDAFCIVSD